MDPEEPQAQRQGPQQQAGVRQLPGDQLPPGAASAGPGEHAPAHSLQGHSPFSMGSPAPRAALAKADPAPVASRPLPARPWGPPPARCQLGLGFISRHGCSWVSCTGPDGPSGRKRWPEAPKVPAAPRRPRHAGVDSPGKACLGSTIPPPPVPQLERLNRRPLPPMAGSRQPPASAVHRTLLLTRANRPEGRATAQGSGTTPAQPWSRRGGGMGTPRGPGDFTLKESRVKVRRKNLSLFSRWTAVLSIAPALASRGKARTGSTSHRQGHELGSRFGWLPDMMLPPGRSGAGRAVAFSLQPAAFERPRNPYFSARHVKELTCVFSQLRSAPGERRWSARRVLRKRWILRHPNGENGVGRIRWCVRPF